MPLYRTKGVIGLAVLVAFAQSGCRLLESGASVHLAAPPGLSEDPAIATRLRRSLDGLLAEIRAGAWTEAHTDPAQRERFAFFYGSLLRGARGAEPLVLKSHPIEEPGAYRVTVAFVGGMPAALSLPRIVELDALPEGDGFRFECPYERNTAQLPSRAVGDVTYRLRGTFDEARAAEFARIKAKLEGLLGIEPRPLQYDCFDSLEALLRAFGFLHDASKCSFLLHDLGFLWHDGQRYATGTGDAGYLFGYVRGLLAHHASRPDEIYSPYLNGVAAYYGGYGLSGDSLEVLARQFRGELARRPTLDFLEEFEKGRGSSIQRHFSHYVMCAFLYGEIVARRGEVAALELLESGAEGQRFFEQLEATIGVTRHNFHATILRLIGACA